MFKSGIDPRDRRPRGRACVTSAYPPARDDLERVDRAARARSASSRRPSSPAPRSRRPSAISPNERLQYRLHPWTSYVIVPLFALANAASISTARCSPTRSPPRSRSASSPPTSSASPSGILLAAWLGTGRRMRPAPAGHLAGAARAAACAGIGFTVSLLIASLAFDGQELEEAKLGVLAAAVAASPARVARVPAMQRLPPEAAGAAARRHRRRRSSTSPTTSTPSSTTSAARRRAGHADRVRRLRVPLLRRGRAVIRELLAHFGDDVRYVWRHLPLNDVHPDAQPAAEAAEAAAAQGRSGRCTTGSSPTRTAATRRPHGTPSALGLDLERFADDLRRREHAPRVADDVRAPTRAASPARRRSSSTAAATTAPTTSTRSPRGAAARARNRGLQAVSGDRDRPPSSPPAYSAAPSPITSLVARIPRARHRRPAPRRHRRTDGPRRLIALILGAPLQPPATAERARPE